MFVDMFHPAVGLTAGRGVWMGIREFQDRAHEVWR